MSSSHDEGNVGTSPPMAAAAAVPDESASPAGVGDRLRHVREDKGLTLADVSQAIKITPRVLEQIEANAWGALSGHTFARGVVRSYARFLQLDSEALLRELENAPLPKPPLLELPKSTRAALPVPGEAQKRDRFAMFSGVVLVALAVVAYFLIPDDWLTTTHSAKTPDVSAAAVLPATTTAVTAAAPAVASEQVPAGQVPPPAVPAAEALPPPAASPAETPVARPPVPVGPAGALSLSFAQESWAEVRDRSGAILISENVSAGGERQLGGDPPYNIWLGNAEGVRVSFRGQPVDLAPHTRQKVARLTLE
jgi:cytoskeleton protein RodZ